MARVKYVSPRQAARAVRRDTLRRRLLKELPYPLVTVVEADEDVPWPAPLAVRVLLSIHYPAPCVEPHLTREVVPLIPLSL
jgi:hypothetical protein